jgi:outer membrane lipoprotein-sorting protein
VVQLAHGERPHVEVDGAGSDLEWVIIDASGGRTRVILESFETGMDLPSSLFNPDLERRRDR